LDVQTVDDLDSFWQRPLLFEITDYMCVIITASSPYTCRMLQQTEVAFRPLSNSNIISVWCSSYRSLFHRHDALFLLNVHTYSLWLFNVAQFRAYWFSPCQRNLWD